MTLRLLKLSGANVSQIWARETVRLAIYYHSRNKKCVFKLSKRAAVGAHEPRFICPPVETGRVRVKKVQVAIAVVGPNQAALVDRRGGNHGV